MGGCAKKRQNDAHLHLLSLNCKQRGLNRHKLRWALDASSGVFTVSLHSSLCQSNPRCRSVCMCKRTTKEITCSAKSHRPCPPRAACSFSSCACPSTKYSLPLLNFVMPFISFHMTARSCPPPALPAIETCHNQQKLSHVVSETPPLST